MTKTKFSGLLILLLVAAQLTMAQTHNIQVDFKKNGVEIQKTMYRIFFEDINYGADGGLYAELVKNRSFDFPQPFLGWSTFGKVEIKNDGPLKITRIMFALAIQAIPTNIPDLKMKAFSV